MSLRCLMLIAAFGAFHRIANAQLWTQFNNQQKNGRAEKKSIIATHNHKTESPSISGWRWLVLTTAQTKVSGAMATAKSLQRINILISMLERERERVSAFRNVFIILPCGIIAMEIRRRKGKSLLEIRECAHRSKPNHNEGNRFM